MLKALRKAFVDGPVDNYEKVASAENIPISRLQHKNHTVPYFAKKIAKIDNPSHHNG